MGGKRKVRFHPDGTKLVAWGDDNFLRVWDVRNGKLLAENRVPPIGMTLADLDNDRMQMRMLGMDASDLSPDGSLLVQSTMNIKSQRTVQFVDTMTGKERSTLEVDPNGVQQLAFSPDGKRLVVAGRNPRREERMPNGRTQTSSENIQPLSVWDLESKKAVWSILVEGKQALNVRFTPDGMRVGMTYWPQDKQYRLGLWDAATGGAAGGIPFVTNPGPFAFDPTGKRVVVGFTDTTAARLQPARPAGCQVILPHGVPPMARTSLFCRLFIATVVGIGSTLSIEAQNPPPPAQARAFIVRSLSFSPDGKTLVAGAGQKDGPGGLVAWNVSTHARLWSRYDLIWVPSVAFLPDGSGLVVAAAKPAVLRIDPANGNTVGELGPNPADVKAVAPIPETDLLATGSDAVVRIWNLKTGQMRAEWPGHTKDVSALAASPDGRWLVSTGQDGARAWDVTQRVELKGAIPIQQGRVTYGSLFLTPDRTIAGNNDGQQLVREFPSGKVILQFENRGGYEGFAYSPSTGLMAYRGYSRPTVSVGELLLREPTPAEATRIAKLIQDFDADDYATREAATKAMKEVGSLDEPALRKAAADGPSPEVRMRSREVRTAILNSTQRTLSGHTGAVGAMTFSPDGKMLATGAADGTVRLWDPATGKELARLDMTKSSENAGK